jgi:predicted O-linked N-acetylglucosamine transferase (SPINDLY family)
MPTAAELDALLARAMSAHQAGRLADAQSSYKAVLKHVPNHPPTLHFLGLSYFQQGKPDRGIELVGKALTLAPDYVEARYNLATALHRLQRYEAAAVHYRQVVAVDAGNADAHNNLGAALQELKRFDEAVAHFRKTLALNPNHAQAHNNLATAFKEIGRFDEAAAHYQKALAINPGDAEVHSNLGSVLLELKRYDAAAEAFDAAIKHNPELEFVEGDRIQARLQNCDWTNYEADRARIEEGVKNGKKVTAPWIFLSLSSSSALQQKCARIFVAHKCPEPQQRAWKGKRYAHDRIRVAYLSADFRDHATSRLIVEMIERHDRTKFEIFAISFGPNDKSAIRARVEKAFEHFIEVRLKSDREVAELMRSLEIDIAVDLMGFTQYERANLLAMRPAPVQVNYLGYAGTVAADFVDYIIADPIIIPPDDRPFFTEKIAYLPHCYQPTDTTRPTHNSSLDRRAAGLPSDGFVFCSFNNSYKIRPELFDIWMRLLNRFDGSVLWLLEASSTCSDNLRREAEKRSVRAERLIFAPRTDPATHLARHGLADLFLDTLPYNAHTTASDALWAGLPLLTCTGSTFASRVAASILTAAGVPELITDSISEYEARAIELANDAALLAAIRDKLKSEQLKSQPLFDTGQMARDMEAGFRMMSERHRRGENAETFFVAGPRV